MNELEENGTLENMYSIFERLTIAIESIREEVAKIASEVAKSNEKRSFGGGDRPPREGSSGGFRPREGSSGGFRPREGGGFRPREGGGFRPREGGGFRPREGGSERRTFNK